MFTTPLELRDTGTPDEWELLRPLVWQDVGGSIWVRKGFITDMASVPRPLRGLLSTTGRSRRPGVLHDWLYCYRSTVFKRLEHLNAYRMTRKEADALLRKALLSEGCSKATAWMYYAGVRLGGWRYWQKRAATGLTDEDFAQ